MQIITNSELNEASEEYLESWGKYEKSLESKYAFEDGFKYAENKFDESSIKFLLKLIIRKIYSKWRLKLRKYLG